MRNILFKKWIPAEWPEGTHSRNQNTYGHYKLKGTGCYSDLFTEKGKFLAWGVGYEELAAGVGQYTLAIVELEDGTVCEKSICHIKFID